MSCALPGSGLRGAWESSASDPGANWGGDDYVWPRGVQLRDGAGVLWKKKGWVVGDYRIEYLDRVPGSRI